MIEECHTLEYIVCVDSWEGNPEHDRTKMSEIETRFDANISEAMRIRARPVNVRKVKDRSNHALPSLILGNDIFDLVFIDGSHRAEDVLTDAINSFSLLRIGGILIFDDYIWREDVSGGQDILNLPKMAIDSFVNVFHKKLVPCRYKPLYQLYLQKVAA